MGEVMQDLQDKLNYSLRQSKPETHAWERIYWREMTKFARLAWQNPDASSRGMAEIAEQYCKESKADIRSELERSRPR
jgi:hypothetical protein